MPTPGEHKTVQSRIGWRFVPREVAERRRGFDFDAASSAEQAPRALLYFDDLLDRKIR